MKSQTIKTIFMGTPEFAVPSLRALFALDSIQIQAVVTQADRPFGRGRQLQASAVKKEAIRLGLHVLSPEKLSEIEATLKELAPDLIVVVAYGKILRPWVLNLPKLEIVNLHASLLPRWRGAAPIARAIMAKDKFTGLCLMRIEEGLDTGAVWLRLEEQILPDDTHSSLSQRLSILGSELWASWIQKLEQGQLADPEIQSQLGITYAKKLEKDEEFLPRGTASLELDALIRGLWPWPGASLRLAPQGQRLRIHVARSVEVKRPVGLTAGVLWTEQKRLFLACETGDLEILKLQREGKNVQSAREWMQNVKQWPLCVQWGESKV